MKKKPHPLKGRKWSDETRARYQATRNANKALAPIEIPSRAALKHAKEAMRSTRVSDAILFLRNAERSIRTKEKFTESDLLCMLALRCLEGK